MDGFWKPYSIQLFANVEGEGEAIKGEGEIQIFVESIFVCDFLVV